MISPFDPEWYPNIDWLIDTPGEWLQYMKNNCRPVWVCFGDFIQSRTESAIEQLAQIALERGYHEENSPGGDVQFVYSNIKKQVVGEKEQRSEFGAPSTASWTSVRSTPTHVLYVAGVEYKRFWGVVNSQVVNDMCDEIVEVMNLFRQNSGDFDRCSGVFIWSGTKSQAYGGNPFFAIDPDFDHAWSGTKSQAYGGNPLLLEDPGVGEWEGTKSQAYSGLPTIVELEEILTKN